jgi:hypothetical protein
MSSGNSIFRCGLGHLDEHVDCTSCKDTIVADAIRDLLMNDVGVLHDALHEMLVDEVANRVRGVTLVIAVDSFDEGKTNDVVIFCSGAQTVKEARDSLMRAGAVVLEAAGRVTPQTMAEGIVANDLEENDPNRAEA